MRRYHVVRTTPPLPTTPHTRKKAHFSLETADCFAAHGVFRFHTWPMGFGNAQIQTIGMDALVNYGRKSGIVIPRR